MKLNPQARLHYGQRGFSLVELLMVLVIFMIVFGAVFRLMNLAMARSSTEQAKLDMFQEAREFMDQMSRDLRQAGYPNVRNYTASALTVSPVANDPKVAAGLVKVSADELWFEGDVTGNGTVSVVHYWYDPATTNNCPCLKRSQLPKVNGNPFSGQTAASYQTEVQGVLNSTIFSAFVEGQTGTPVTLPVDFNSNASTLAGIDTVQAVLTVESKFFDPQTKVKPLSTLNISVKLNNCSLAANTKAMSCYY
jgi:prepilin-type N-terminal cleavage/methylation domain-containing protein